MKNKKPDANQRALKLGAIHENCQIGVQGSCHEISGCFPKVHHRLQQEQSKVDMNCLQ